MREREALGGRALRLTWAVVPEPTRTTEAVAALYLGRSVPPGAGPASPADLGLPFAHLGYESAALVGVDQAVLISIEEYRSLTSARPQLKDFLLAKPFRGLELGRAGHRSRDVDL